MKMEKESNRMADLVYECAANKSHPQKKFVIDQQTVPQCCGKPMTRLQAPQTQPTTSPATTPRYSPTGKTSDKGK
ncbi:MAG: hypothetical protein HY549_01620 [Elusimicrobia bacterium]|nr:hypothetical protein [Elusimicrobiota bacterium]